MIDKAIREEVRASVIPVLLGDGAKASRLASRLYTGLGIVSLRLGRHRRLSDLLGLSCVFRRASVHDRLLCEQLLAIAEEFEGYLLWLIPTDEASRQRVAAMGEELESRFIIRESDVLVALLFGSICQAPRSTEEGHPKQM